jgi:hypothetical protein
MFAINFWPVLVASIAMFIVGAIWFGPKTFYPVWMRALDREVPTERVEMSKGETLLMFGGTYVGALIQAFTVAVVILLAREVPGGSVNAVTGGFLGFFLALGIGAFSSLSHRMFSHPNFKVYKAIKVWLIEIGQDVVCLTIAGLIIGAWV